jgi:predicted SnoaL-like aldol condensation-catalyzing enzyme
LSAEREAGIRTLLKGIETGDPDSVLIVNPEKYIQHNPQTHEGREGLAALFKRLSQTSPRVNIVRICSDCDFVFGHTEYEFSTSRVGFEVFRFEGDQAVEHWDNIESRKGPNSSGRSMVDGTSEVSDLHKTEENRALVTEFVDSVLIGRQLQNLPGFVSEQYMEHNPSLSDGLPSLRDTLKAQSSDGSPIIRYEKRHRVLAKGNFVLSICEGFREGSHTSFYDLYRIEHGIIVEHWDTTETVPPPNEWKNENGKF